MNTPFQILDSAAWQALADAAAHRPKIYSDCWHEGEFACVLGSNAADAAQKAFQVAQTVAGTRKVLFFNLRGNQGNLAVLPKNNSRNILLVNVDLADLDPKDIDGFFAQIEETIKASGANICVFSSLFHLCEWRGKSAGARFFIQKIRELTRRLRISLLLGATVRKRIAKNTVPSAEHLPKNTAPFFDTIIVEAQEPTRNAAESEAVLNNPDIPDSPIALEKSPTSPSFPSQKHKKLSHRLSHPGVQLRK